MIADKDKVNVTRRDVLAGGALAVATLATRSWPAFGAEAAPLTASPALPVALRRCRSYDAATVHGELVAALDSLGGIAGLVRGKTVTVKLNLTGDGASACGRTAARTYQVNPVLVAALCAILARHGARRVVLAESMYFREPPEEALARQGWDVAAIRAAGDHRVTFENTRNRGAWPSYARLAVPGGGLVFPAFDVNARYRETDVLVSLAKLKEHDTTLLTGAVKNLFGILPMSLYGDDAPNEESLLVRADILHYQRRGVPAGVPAARSSPGQVGAEEERPRVARIIADCLAACPVDLAVLDGVETVAGGAGPWTHRLRPIAPGLLLAGRDAVGTDTVAAAVIGADTAAIRTPILVEGHLRLAAAAGLGNDDLSRIEVRGLALDAARYPFRLAHPARLD